MLQLMNSDVYDRLNNNSRTLSNPAHFFYFLSRINRVKTVLGCFPTQKQQTHNPVFIGTATKVLQKGCFCRILRTKPLAF